MVFRDLIVRNYVFRVLGCGEMMTMCWWREHWDHLRILPAYKLLTESSDHLFHHLASHVLLEEGHHQLPVLSLIWIFVSKRYLGFRARYSASVAMEKNVSSSLMRSLLPTHTSPA